MNDHLAEIVKNIYSRYHNGTLTAEETLNALELAFAESNEGASK